MIGNNSINEKLSNKTEDQPILRDFIDTLFENEVEGKNYKKFYNSEILKSTELEQENKNEVL